MAYEAETNDRLERLMETIHPVLPQKAMKKFFAMLVLAISGVLSIHAQPVDFNQGKFADSNYLIELPFETVRGKIVVTIRIAEEARKFIVDTGAPTAISQELYQKLNSEIVSVEQVSDVNNQMDSLLVVRMDQIQVGNAIYEDIPALVINDGILTDCFKVDGLIGSNLLRNSIVQFDDRNGIIRITNDLENVNVLNAKQADIVLDRQSSPILTIRFGKYASEMLLFDSGSDEFYSMSNQNMQKFKKSNAYDVVGKSKGSNSMGINGVGGNAETYKLHIPSMLINETEIRNTISESNVDFNSRIGRPLLDLGVFTLDFQKKKSYFEPYASSEELNESFWDIDPTFIDGKLAVGKIWAKELKKIEVGDQILAVNDINTSSISMCEFLMDSPFRDLAKATITVKSKDGKVHIVEIVKRNTFKSRE